MADLCADNRFDLIEKYKKKLIEATNIETSTEEMKVLDNILFRFWQMGWLEKLEQPPHSGRRVYMAGYAEGFEAGKKAVDPLWSAERKE